MSCFGTHEAEGEGAARLRMLLGLGAGAQEGIGRAPLSPRSIAPLVFSSGPTKCLLAVHTCAFQPCCEMDGCPGGVCHTGVWMLFTERETWSAVMGFVLWPTRPPQPPGNVLQLVMLSICDECVLLTSLHLEAATVWGCVLCRRQGVPGAALLGLLLSLCETRGVSVSSCFLWLFCALCSQLWTENLSVL